MKFDFEKVFEKIFYSVLIFGVCTCFYFLFVIFGNCIIGNAEDLTLTIPNSSWHGANISSTFSRSVDTPAPPEGYVLAGVAASDFWQYTNCIAYYVPNNNTSWLCRGEVNSSGVLTNLDNFSASSGTIMFSLRKKADGTWDNFTTHASYNVGGFGAIWCKLPLVVSDGTTLSPSSVYPDDLFTMSSLSTSDQKTILKVSYNGSSSSSFDVSFYACSADTYSSWWGSASADVASNSFTNLPSSQSDGTSDNFSDFLDNFFSNRLPKYFGIDSTTRLTPITNSLTRRNTITSLPSPRVVIGYDKVSSILPAESVVNWSDWLNNRDMGGVYASNDIVIVARINFVVSDNLSTYYFCSQQFDLSSIVSSAYTPEELNTKTQPYVAPSDVSDLDKLATYIRYLEVNNNVNDNIRYNNFVHYLEQNTPLFVLQGLNGWLPSLSFELDSLFDGFSVNLSVPSSSDIASLQNQIDLSQAAFVEKFAWTAVITSEVDFVTSTVVAAGDTPPVISVDASYYSPSSSRNVDYGQIVLFDGTKISVDIVDKCKDIITVFCSLGLLFFIYKTLPSTIGRIPEK